MCERGKKRGRGRTDRAVIRGRGERIRGVGQERMEEMDLTS